ncbi:MAG: DMT family transporter [Alphaproteobacteria bacterium]|nr:DMT family transporter [Alphaproteobacteria bacterium]
MSDAQLLQSRSVDAPLKGVVYLAVGGLFLTLGDAVVKWLSTSIPPGEILFGRNTVTLVLTLAVAWRSSQPLAALRTQNLRDQIARGLSAAAFSFVMVEALRRLPLAEVYTFLFSAPILLALLAPRMLGEHVGTDRWLAISVGFVGVLTMLRPGVDGLHWATLLALACAVLSALRDILNRRIVATDTSLAIQLYTNLSIVVISAATFPFGWKAIDLADATLLVLCGLIQFVGQYFFIDAFRYATTTLLAPFKYILLVWALATGFAVWGDVPDGWSLAGTLLIVGSGLFIVVRSRKPKQRQPI